MTITHIAAQDITIDGRHLRQRCAWCGEILIDYDLTRVAVPTDQPGPPATWPVGLVRIDGAASWTVDGQQLPDDSCTRQLGPDVEQAAVTACGNLAATLRGDARMRDLAARLVETASLAVLAANHYATDRAVWEQLCDAADALHQHLVATEPASQP